MKTLLTLICLLATPAFAKNAYKLDDPAIMGSYKLAKADKKSDLQSARIGINSEKKLTLTEDRDDNEFELTGPDKNGVIYSDDSGEANCDGDESSCSYDASTKITLLSTTDKKGNVIPQIKIDIVVSYAWQSDCGDGQDQPDCTDENYSYVLNWSNSNPDDVSPYTDIQNTRLQKAADACRKALGQDFIEIAKANYFAWDFCAAPVASMSISTDFDTAFKSIEDVYVGGNQKNPKEISVDDVKDLFAQSTKLAKAYKDDGKDVKVTSADMQNQIQKIQAAVLEYDRFFAIPKMGDDDLNVYVFAYDTKAKIVSKFQILVK